MPSPHQPALSGCSPEGQIPGWDTLHVARHFLPCPPLISKRTATRRRRAAWAPAQVLTVPLLCTAPEMRSCLCPFSVRGDWQVQWVWTRVAKWGVATLSLSACRPPGLSLYRFPRLCFLRAIRRPPDRQAALQQPLLPRRLTQHLPGGSWDRRLHPTVQSRSHLPCILPAVQFFPSALESMTRLCLGFLVCSICLLWACSTQTRNLPRSCRPAWTVPAGSVV